MALSTNQDFVNLLLNRLGKRSGASSDFRAAVVDEINASLYALEVGSFLPWFLRTSGTTVTVANSREYDLPTGFIREVEEEDWVITDADGEPRTIKKLLWEDLDRKYPNYTTSDADGNPAYYAITGLKLLLGPRPDDAYTLTYTYYVRSSTILDDVLPPTNPWLLYAPNMLIAHAGIQVAGYLLLNQDLKRSFQESYAIERANLIANHEARFHTNRDYSSLEDTVGTDL